MLADSVADPLFKIKLGVACDLAGEHDQVAFRERFASDAAQRILFETGVEDVIADGIANFVGMTFGDGFGGKDVTMRHGESRDSLKGYNVKDCIDRSTAFNDSTF